MVYQACIDQTDISNDLLCLPMFLAGCENLLIIAGPTYAERLWCILEIFVFLKNKSAEGGLGHGYVDLGFDERFLKAACSLAATLYPQKKIS